MLPLLGISAETIGQTQAPGTIDWGNNYRQPNKTAATKIIGITGDGFYMLREKVLRTPNAKPKVWVEYFTKDMKLQRSEELDLKYQRKQRDFEDVIMLNRKLYLLTTFNNTAKKKNFLFKQEVNSRTLAPSKNLDMIGETEARNKAVEGSFSFRLSSDSSRLLIFNDLPFEKKNPKRFGFRVFDENFSLLWQKNISLPYPDDQFTVEEYRVDSKGNVFLLGVLYKDGAKWRRRGNPSYQYVLLSYLDKGEKVDEYRFDLENKFITDLTFRIARDSTLVFSGFYSEKGTYSIKGVYFFHLQPHTGQMSNQNAAPLDFDFLTAFMSDRKKEKARQAEMKKDVNKAPELYDYSLDELILRSDGGAVLVAEQFYVDVQEFPYYTPSAYGGYYRYSQVYYYNYNDIIVINIRPNGEIEWSARIPKWQETRNDGGYYSSYAMANVRDKLYFVYNDNSHNYSGGDRLDKSYTYTGGKGVIALSEVNIKGEVQTWLLSSNKDSGIIMRPKMCRQTGRREMAIFGEYNRGFRFGELRLE